MQAIQVTATLIPVLITGDVDNYNSFSTAYSDNNHGVDLVHLQSILYS